MDACSAFALQYCVDFHVALDRYTGRDQREGTAVVREIQMHLLQRSLEAWAGGAQPPTERYPSA